MNYIKFYILFIFLFFINIIKSSCDKCSCDQILLNTILEKPEQQVSCTKYCLPKTFFLPRSQGTNTARWLVGWERFLAPFKDHVQNGNINLVIEYSHSFDSKIISEYLFGSQCLSFKGSEVPNRDPNRDIMADYFGLAPDFQGKICFKPKIQNVIAEVNYYLALDSWIKGLYARIHFPLTVTFWDLGSKIVEKKEKVRPIFPECYMSTNTSVYTQTLSNLKQALSGFGLFGNMTTPFNFGQFPFKELHKTGIADIYVILGLTFISKPRHNLAFYFQSVIPGGNRPESVKFFEPIVGNGKSWEFGFGSEGRTVFFSTENHSLGFYFMGYFTHRFKTLQIRSFDFKDNGLLSRYLLLKQLKQSKDKYFYADNLINAINYATKAARVGGLIVGDASFKISYYIKKFGLDFGYNIWGTTAERIEIVPRLYPSDLNHILFGIKGTTGVCYRILNKETDYVTPGKSLNSTESLSTIANNSEVNNPQPIILEYPDVAIEWDSPINNNLKIAKDSNPPVFVKLDDLDPCSAAVPAQLSHKFFAHIDYNRFGIDWEPEIGLGGQIEFNGRKKLKSTTSQWAVWLKSQVTF